MPIARLLAEIGATAADLVLPRECAGCAAAGPVVCRACAESLATPATLCWPTPPPPRLPPPYAVAPYDGAVRALINAYKERAQFALARPLGEALGRAVLAAYGDRVGRDAAILLVPVPTARASVRRRGHDPIGRLARIAAARLRRAGYPASCLPVLRQVRRLSDQAALTSADRWVNLAGALFVPPRLVRAVEARTVVLVDDVITTGATLAEAARALSEAGATPAGAAVIAATERRRAPTRPHEGALLTKRVL